MTAEKNTKALLSAIPIPDIHTEKKRIILKGEVTSPIEPKPGCRFAARCPHACEQCKQPQTIREIEPGHFISCVRACGGIRLNHAAWDVIVLKYDN